MTQGLPLPDEHEMFQAFNQRFMDLSPKERLEMQFAVTVFAFAYQTMPEARSNGLTLPQYGELARQIREVDASGERTFKGIDANAGLERLVEIGGCVKQNDIPGQYAPTMLGDRAIMYTIGVASTK